MKIKNEKLITGSLDKMDLKEKYDVTLSNFLKRVSNIFSRFFPLTVYDCIHKET